MIQRNRRRCKGRCRCRPGRRTSADRGTARQTRVSLAAAPIVIRRVGFAIRTRGIKIVTVWIFPAGIEINVSVVPGIFRQFFIELIPACRLRIRARLNHERLQALLSCRQESIHALVKFELSTDSLDVRRNADVARYSTLPPSL